MNQIELPHNHGEAVDEDYLHVLEITDFQIVADVFKQLSDSSRIQIYWLLCHCEECVINISAMVSMSSPAVSHHLRILKNSGLIVSRRVGKEVYYKASDSVTSTELHHMIEKMMEIHCPEDKKAVLSPYLTTQAEILNEIHEKLIGNLSKRYTIEELSAEFLMNPTTLKNTFKAIYGQPIASYMKKYRLDAAASHLKESSESIAVIAAEVGYESQGKFTNAFKEQFGLSPSDYRKQFLH